MSDKLKNEKYYVFKNEKGLVGARVEDAVVIRKQDVFAAPALDAYSNAITCAVELMPDDSPHKERLKDLADFFHQQAVESWIMDRKIPD